MRRLFWLGVGAAAGIYGMRRLTSAAQAYTPAGMAGNLGTGLASLGDGLREMAGVVREGMAEREAELRVALGIDTGIGPGAESGAELGAGPGSGRSSSDRSATEALLAHARPAEQMTREQVTQQQMTRQQMTQQQAQQLIEDPTGPRSGPGGAASRSHRAR